MSRVVWIGVLAVAALAGIWLYSEFELVPDRQWTGLSGEARLRPYLAAERFAERMGMPAKELRALPDLDVLPAGGTLLLPRLRQTLDKKRLDALLAWVERGGHLVVEAEAAARPDPLTDRLGLGRKAHATSKPAIVEIQGRQLSVALTGGPLLTGSVRNPRLSAGDKDGWLLVSIPRGRGLVTATSTLGFARNEFVGQGDHPEFLWALLRLTPASELRVFLRPQKLSLWSFLVEHATPVLLGAAALLALWLWRVAPRFGPLVPDAPPARRRLLDHLRASGRYFWSRGGREPLFAAARDAALRRLTRSQPDFAQANIEERSAQLARLTGVPEAEALRFLAVQGETLRGGAFIDMVRVAQRVHAALDKGKT